MVYASWKVFLSQSSAVLRGMRSHVDGWASLVILSVGLIAGCSGENSADNPLVVAVFKGGVVRREEFDAFRRATGPEGAPLAAAPGEDWREANVIEIAFHKALAAEARKDEKDPQLEAAIRQAEADVLQAAMAEELGWSRIAASPEEIRGQYDAHPEQYKDPERRRIQYIYLRAEEGATPDAERQAVRRQLEDFHRQVLAGADLEELARRHSQSSTAHSGGWLTVAADADVHPSFREAIWELQKGEVSGIIETPTGFQFARLMEILPALDRPFETVVEFARRRANADKLAAAQAAFVAEVGPRHGLQLNYERLDDPFIAPDEALITIGDERYTFSNLCFALNEHQLSQLYAGYHPKIRTFLDGVARNRILGLEAERIGLRERPEVARRLEDAVRDVKYEWALNQRLMRMAAEVSETDLRAYYEQNKDRYQTLRTRDLDVILLKSQGDEPLWMTLKRGEALVARIRAGEDFAEIARTHSRHYSASTGGRMEGLSNHDVKRVLGPRPWFGTIINNLKPGEVSDAVMAEVYDPEQMAYFDTGIIIVRLIKDTPPEQKSFEEAVDFIRDNYTRQNYQTLAAQVRREVLESIDLKVFLDRLPPL